MNPVAEIQRLRQCLCELNERVTTLEEGGVGGGGGTCMQMPYTFSIADDQTPGPGEFQIDSGSLFINVVDGNADNRFDTFDFYSSGSTRFVFTGQNGFYFFADLVFQGENSGVLEYTISDIDVDTEPAENEEGCVMLSVGAVAPDMELGLIMAISQGNFIP